MQQWAINWTSSQPVFAFILMTPAKRFTLTGLAITKGIFALVQAMIKACSNRYSR